MGAISEYIHVISSLEVYPRIFYYHKRYSDILRKLKNITGKYAKLFESEHHDFLSSPFDHGIELRIFGENDIRPHNFIPVESKLYKVDVVSRKGPGDKSYVDNIVAVEPVWLSQTRADIEAKDGNEPMDLSISADHSSVTVTVCYANIQRLDEEGIEKVTQLLRHVSTVTPDKPQHCFLLCETNNKFNQADENVFKSKIENRANLLPLHDIVIGTGNNVSIKNEVSMFLESLCIQRFTYLKNILQNFTKGQRSMFTRSLLETEAVAKQLKRVLSNICGIAFEEPEADVEEKLANVVKCIAVNAFSEKYNLQVWICNGIVNAYSFQQKLKQSFSKDTRHRLIKIVTLTPGSEQKVPIETVINVYSRRIVRNLQKELRSVFTDVEKHLSQFSSAVRKMLLEINGCLKKSSLAYANKESSFPVLDVELRRDILRINGVYGVGTIYGEIEVHANPGTNVTALESEIRMLMRKKSHVSNFAVRTLYSKPEMYVDCQYENGEPIESLCPVRKGTLGGFVDGSDNKLYGLTCAHVVKCHGGQENNVFIKDSRNKQCLFAKSFPKLTVSTGEPAKPLIDIAAVRIVDEMTDKCIKFLKDDTGKIKPAVLAADRPSDMVGMKVYKHGAMSYLTNGLVCSDDYGVLDEDDEIEYIMLIDNYEDIDDLFAIPGDSGSTVCIPDENEPNIIKVVGVLSAGQFRPTGYDMPLYFSFRLYDGLRKLTSKAGGLQFNFPQMCT